jgi:hypothetical protein
MPRKLCLNSDKDLYILPEKNEIMDLSTEENMIWLSTNHIQNLQMASVISGREIAYNSGVNGFLPVEVSIKPNSNSIGIIFLEDNYDRQKFNLVDYEYILNMFILS